MEYPAVAGGAAQGGQLEAGVGVSDCCLLQPLDGEHFLHNLRMRFQHQVIYVSEHYSYGKVDQFRW